MKNILRHFCKALTALVVSLGLVLGVLAVVDRNTIRRTAVQFGVLESPYYHNGDTQWDHGGIEEYYFNQLPGDHNEIYRELYSRIAAGEDSADLYAQVDEDRFWNAYYAVMADHPEFFWVGSAVSVQQSRMTGNIVSYSLTSEVDPEDRESVRSQLEAAADECISRIPEGASEYEKIKSVYKYIIDTTDYDAESPNNQNIPSVLLGKASVCAGYAKTFQYILHRMGMFCTYVTGETSNGGDHGWNIVRIGDSYYNVDVTWGDPVFAGEQDHEGGAELAMNYNYLCCTDEELYRTHTADGSIPLPACTDDSLNYYRLNGMYYDSFDWETIRWALMDSVYSGDRYIALKFGDDAAFAEAKTALFEEDLLQEPAEYLMTCSGASSWNYRYNTDEEFCLITIYWDV